MAATNGRRSLVTSRAGSVSERSRTTIEEEDEMLDRDIPYSRDGCQGYLKVVAVVLPGLVTSERDGMLELTTSRARDEKEHDVGDRRAAGILLHALLEKMLYFCRETKVGQKRSRPMTAASTHDLTQWRIAVV
ncbi:hypothetical protein B296_00046607 [Ensete ventricosum]|uniref:Uncharacterized protein n=1 Tax=Ensete ventricosum TaxID=4639 RepID=A0A426XM99_ENSVE|nr:hypothetical protein B296_00046607 [Ensete ventricosum]